MAHLLDMEELLSSIKNPDIRDYMSEAMACYMAGAYRASVVLSFIALFDDLMTKLGELSKVNSKARQIFDSASKKRFDQDVFESYLLDQLRANNLISGLDADFFEMLRGLRNKAAHPSGHHASAEEARFVFRDVIKRVLSIAILSTTQLANEILASLTNENYFPSRKIEVVEKVVERELKNIDPDAYAYLVNKLVEKSRETEPRVRLNARFFLAGMARGADPVLRNLLQKYTIEKIASDKAHNLLILTMLSSDGQLFAGLDEITCQRVQVLLAERIKNVDEAIEHRSYSHPAAVFVSLFDAKQIDEVYRSFPVELESFLKRFTYSAFFAKRIVKHEKVLKSLIEIFIDHAAANNLDVANDFVGNLAEIEILLSEVISPMSAFEMLVNVIRSAANGADLSIDMRNSYFKAIPVLRSKAQGYLREHAEEARSRAISVLAQGSHLEDSLKYLAPTP